MDSQGAPMLEALMLEMRGRWRSHPPDGPPKDLGHDLLLEALSVLRFYPDMPWAYLVWERDQSRVTAGDHEREAIRQLHDLVDNWLRLPQPEPGFYDWTPFADIELFEEDRLAQEEQERQKDGRYYVTTTKDGPRIDACVTCGKRRPLRAGRNVCEPCRRERRGQTSARVRTHSRPSVHGFELKTWDEDDGRYVPVEGVNFTELTTSEQQELLSRPGRQGKRPQRMSSTGHQPWIRTCLRAAADEAGYSFEDFTAPLPEGRPSGGVDAGRRDALARVVYELHEQGVTLESIGVALGSNKMQAQRLKNRGKQATN
jgi:hypothetical protein